MRSLDKQTLRPYLRLLASSSTDGTIAFFSAHTMTRTRWSPNRPSFNVAGHGQNYLLSSYRCERKSITEEREREREREKGVETKKMRHKPIIIDCSTSSINHLSVYGHFLFGAIGNGFALVSE